jgi:hypothetical protein
MHRTVCAAVLLCFVCNFSIHAQDAPKPKRTVNADLFGGFSYANYRLISINSNSSSSTLSQYSGSGRLGLYGWNAAASANFKPWFGLVADVSGVYSDGSASLSETATLVNCSIPGASSCTQTFQYIAPKPKIHNFLFGPQFAYPHGKVRPFARLLVGANHRDYVWPQSFSIRAVFIPITPSVSAPVLGNHFSITFGGGVDYPFHRKFALRTTLDYLTGQGAGQNGVRVSSGLLWHIG